jgi:hypothetical protein
LDADAILLERVPLDFSGRALADEDGRCLVDKAIANQSRATTGTHVHAAAGAIPTKRIVDEKRSSGWNRRQRGRMGSGKGVPVGGTKTTTPMMKRFVVIR